MHSFYIYCNNDKNSFGSSENVQSASVGEFSRTFFVWIFKRISVKKIRRHTHKCHQYFPRWWSSCEGSISVYFWFNKDDKASTQDFPRLNQDSRPTFWRKIYWQQCLEKWTQKRRFSTPGASLVKIECTFFISTSSRPKLIYNEARHTSSTSLKSQQTLMNWSSCWYYHTQYQTSPLL